MARRGLVAVVLAVACADGTGPIALDPASFTLIIGSRKQILVLSGGRPLATEAGAQLAWASSDNSVALVNRQGDVLGVSGGTATVTARLGSQVSTAAVRVIPSAGGVWLGSVSDSFYTFALNEVTVGSDPTSTVVGTANVRDNRDSVTMFGVQGTYTSPSIELFLSRPGKADATLTAAFSSDNTIEGQLAGLGATPQALTLTRPTCFCPPLLTPPVGPARGKERTPCAASVLCR